MHKKREKRRNKRERKKKGERIRGGRGRWKKVIPAVDEEGRGLTEADRLFVRLVDLVHHR